MTWARSAALGLFALLAAVLLYGASISVPPT
jgi:hypothetical protein